MACLTGIDIVQENGGKAAGVMTPLNSRVRLWKGIGQRAEWRCLSFLDSRVVAVPEEAQSAVLLWQWGRAATVATESSLNSGDAVEREDSTAWLASWFIGNWPHSFFATYHASIAPATSLRFYWCWRR
jgi:hypothetical protein